MSEPAQPSRAELLQLDVALIESVAWCLKDHAQSAFQRQPAISRRAADLLQSLGNATANRLVAALAVWAEGIAAMATGDFFAALEWLQRATVELADLHLSGPAAQTLVARMAVLSMLGRHDEAIACGTRAQSEFEASGDTFSLAKVQLNLGGIHFLRDDYVLAAEQYEHALVGFRHIGDEPMSIAALKGLADTRARQYALADALNLYEAALNAALKKNLALMVASIRHNMGLLALLRGDYEVAQQLLQQALHGFESIHMPQWVGAVHQSLGELYLELNLSPEAVSHFKHAIQTYQTISLKSHLGRARAHYGRALAQAGQLALSVEQFALARQAFDDDTNAVGTALVDLWWAESSLRLKHWLEAKDAAARAEPPLAAAGLQGLAIFASVIACEAEAFAGGDGKNTAAMVRAAQHAEQLGLDEVQLRALEALSACELANHDVPGACATLDRAIRIAEQGRARLRVAELRTAYFMGKQNAFELRLAAELQQPQPDVRVMLDVMERSRARTLLDQIHSSTTQDARPVADASHELRLRYRQLLSGSEANAPSQFLQTRIAALEVELTRSLRAEERLTTPVVPTVAAAADGIFAALGGDSTVLEYHVIGDEIIAIRVTPDGIALHRKLGSRAAAVALMRSLRYQTDTLRLGAERLQRHATQLQRGADRALRALYDLLLAPMESWLTGSRLVIVPYAELHYVPFEALLRADGKAVIDRMAVSRAPSFALLTNSLTRVLPKAPRALILGVEDSLEHIRDEISVVAEQFDHPRVATGSSACSAQLFDGVDADVLHLACHASFRSDNPYFSALRLADADMTARDIARCPLSQVSLVTLSGCETGVGDTAPGEELVGLTRSFFAAGAARVISSLWTVDDASTAYLMQSLYRGIAAATPAVDALRVAQLATRARFPHPYHWAAFCLHGA